MSGSRFRWFGWALDPHHARRVAFLSETSLFSGLPTRLLGRLAAMLPEKAYAPGDVIFFEGDPAQALFIVLDGNVEIIVSTPEGEQCVAVCGPSTAFGELALISARSRAATARATVPTKLLLLFHSDFEQLLKRDRRIACVVMQNLLQILASYLRSVRASAAPESEVLVDTAARSARSRAWDSPRNPS